MSFVKNISDYFGEMINIARPVMGALVGFFGAGIIVAIWYDLLPTHPCELLPMIQCRMLSGQDYATFDEFLTSQPALLMTIFGAIAGAVGGSISG